MSQMFLFDLIQFNLPHFIDSLHSHTWWNISRKGKEVLENDNEIIRFSRSETGTMRHKTWVQKLCTQTWFSPIYTFWINWSAFGSPGLCLDGNWESSKVQFGAGVHKQGTGSEPDKSCSLEIQNFWDQIFLIECNRMNLSFILCSLNVLLIHRGLFWDRNTT